MAVAIRLATTSDADSIAALAMSLVEQHVGYDSLRFSRIGPMSGMAAFYGGLETTDNAVLIVADLEGKLVGFAYMQYEPILYAELATQVAWLHDIYVEPAARGTGAGKELIKSAANEAKRLGASKMLLSVAARNAEAREFFEHQGFRTTMLEMMLPIEKD